MGDAGVVLILVLTGWTYAAGARRAWRGAGPGRLITRGQARWFGAGLAALAVALLPPLASRGDHSLAAHMVQHVLLLVVIAPLLVLGDPVSALLWALPERWRRPVSRPWRRALRSHARSWLLWAAGTFLAAAAVMISWHVSVLYEFALHHEPVHAVEHATFLVTAAAFWWAVGIGSPRPRGAAVAVVFVGALPGTALGAAMTLAARPWYAEYPSLADQQLAGVVMWAFAGLAYVLAAAVVFGLWLAAVERDSPARPLAAAEMAATQ